MIQIRSTQKLPSFKKLADKFHLDLVVLFGSQVTGRVHPESDVDIAVRGTKILSLSQQLELARQLDKVLIDTDLVDLRRASPLMLASVATTGQVLFERRKNAFAHFRLLAINQYLDFKTHMKFLGRKRARSKSGGAVRRLGSPR